MRTTCRSCESNNLKQILAFGDLYLSDFTSTKKKPKKFPINLILCDNCFLLQTDYTVPSKYLYTERYGYRSGINSTMKKELQDIVEKVKEMVQLQKNDMVIDIGANDGTLLSNYDKTIYTIGVEPVNKLAKICKKSAKKVVNDFFSKNNLEKTIKRKDKAKIITAISMFYDLEDPNSFVADLKNLLDEDGVIIIQQNYLVQMLAQNAFDNLCHEHIEYYSLASMEYLLKQHNLEIFHVELSPINGGSFRTYICHKGSRKINKSVLEMRKSEKKMKITNKKTYLEFAKRIKAIKKELLAFVQKEHKKGKTIYLLGASTRGNTLIQICGLDTTYITAAMERNPEKWGKYYASVDIPIISEEQARKEKPDYMLVLPWFFKEEIIAREKEYLTQGGHLIFPLPDITII